MENLKYYKENCMFCRNYEPHLDTCLMCDTKSWEKRCIEEKCSDFKPSKFYKPEIIKCNREWAKSCDNCRYFDISNLYCNKDNQPTTGYEVCQYFEMKKR